MPDFQSIRTGGHVFDTEYIEVLLKEMGRPREIPKGLGRAVDEA